MRPDLWPSPVWNISLYWLCKDDTVPSHHPRTRYLDAKNEPRCVARQNVRNQPVGRGGGEGKAIMGSADGSVQDPVSAYSF
jgi:hypothetical protein